MSLFWEVVQGVTIFFLGTVAMRVWDSRRKLRFSASGWTVSYEAGLDSEATRIVTDKLPENPPPGMIFQYGFEFKIFNERSEPTGLQGFAVEFVKGGSLSTTILGLDSFPCDMHFEGYSHVNLAAQAFTWRLVQGRLKWNSSLQGTQSVWLIAHTPDGRRYRWPVVKLRSLDSSPVG
jgi:hypothetical protein